MKANFMFDDDHNYTIQDAYVLGNLFSYNYIDSVGKFKGKRASFISRKNKPQTTNTTGFEYTKELFEAYKTNLEKFLKKDEKYNDIEIKILWDEINSHDGVFEKRKGTRVLYFNLDFDYTIDYGEILRIVRIKIINLNLFIWFFRGIIDTRGSIDKTTKKIAVDMDSRYSAQQANEITILSKKYFSEIAHFTNYNPRNNQPSKTSKSKNSQMRPNLEHYLSKVGTINPQLINYYYFIFNTNCELLISDIGEYFISIKKTNKSKKQPDRLDELRIDNKIKRKNHGYVEPRDSNFINRKCLSTEEKINIWSKLFNGKTLDETDIDFILMEWHHAIPNSLKNDKKYSDYHYFIDQIENFVPLSPNSHTLIHKRDVHLNEKTLKEKKVLLHKIFGHLKKYLNISEDEIYEIYK